MSQAGNLTTYLASMERQIVPMLADGNCMFRSMAHQLVGDAEQHHKLRDATIVFVSQNENLLRGYLPDGQPSIQHHLNQMCKHGCWGTQLELKALASMLQITDSLVPGEYRWTYFQPCACDHKFVPDWLTCRDLPEWIEISYSKACHYDSIQSTSSSHSPPALSSAENTCDVIVVD